MKVFAGERKDGLILQYKLELAWAKSELECLSCRLAVCFVVVVSFALLTNSDTIVDTNPHAPSQPMKRTTGSTIQKTALVSCLISCHRPLEGRIYRPLSAQT